MTDTNDSNDRKLGGAGGQSRTLSMRRPVEQSRVKQNFSHGRTKTVVVETRRKRPGGQGDSCMSGPVDHQDGDRGAIGHGEKIQELYVLVAHPC